jgi:hypothetical protein
MHHIEVLAWRIVPKEGAESYVCSQYKTVGRSIRCIIWIAGIASIKSFLTARLEVSHLSQIVDRLAESYIIQ